VDAAWQCRDCGRMDAGDVDDHSATGDRALGGGGPDSNEWRDGVGTDGGLKPSGELRGQQRRAVELRSMPTSQNRDMGHPTCSQFGDG